MRGGRLALASRRAGLARVLALGITGVVLSGNLSAESHHNSVAANARPPSSQSFEGYPRVGALQGVRITQEVVSASVRSIVRSPLASARLIVGRSLDRLSLRDGEESPHTDLRSSSGSVDCGCGQPGPSVEAEVPARLTLLPTSELSIRVLLDRIASARQRIDLMMYGWEDDPTGREVAEALAVRAQEGVRVRLLVDRGGFLIHNAKAAGNGCTFLDALRTVPNLSVVEPENPFLRFDHRKLAVIDGGVAWSGGMILTEVARRCWQNLAFLAEGPIVDSYASLFENRWREVGGCPEAPVAPNDRLSPGAINATVQLIRTDVGEQTLRQSIYDAVDRARHQIMLANPYFTDEILVIKLVQARARGVDVRAILTVRSNVRVLNQYTTLIANRLLRGGVAVYLFPGMTHVKAMSADGEWAYIGTGNFDELSLRNNNEVGLSIQGPEVARELDRRVFLPEMAVSQELTKPLPLPRSILLLKLFSRCY